jgi:hypothetical protein
MSRRRYDANIAYRATAAGYAPADPAESVIRLEQTEAYVA